MKPICFSWSLFWKCNRPPLFFAGSRVFRNVCVCVHFISLHHMRSCLFFFLITFLHTPDDDQKGTCGLKTSFIFLFRLHYQKTWLLAWAAVTGTGHYDTHPPLLYIKQRVRMKRSTAKKSRKYIFLHIHNNIYVKVCSHQSYGSSTNCKALNEKFNYFI